MHHLQDVSACMTSWTGIDQQECIIKPQNALVRINAHPLHTGVQGAKLGGPADKRFELHGRAGR